MAAWLALWLSGCGSTGALSVAVDLTVYTEERWSADIDILFASQHMQLAGEQTESAITAMVECWRAQGARASLAKTTLDNGNVRFHLHVAGQGLDQLNAALFDRQAVLTLEAATPPQIHFRYAPLGSVLGAALTRRFTLNGGTIMSSNGVRVSDSTVTWSNPTDVMEARLTPATWVAWPVWTAVGVGGLALAAAGVGLWRALAKTTCAECGGRIPSRAVYCPMCGLERRR